MSADFPDYAVKETKDAIASRRTFTGDQVKALDDILWNLASDPGRFAPLSTRQSTGQLLYRDPAFGVEVLYRVDAAEKILYLFHVSAPMAPRRTIFISYSHQDTEWLELFRKFLGVLENAGIIKFWDRLRHQAGRTVGGVDSARARHGVRGIAAGSQDFLCRSSSRPTSCRASSPTRSRRGRRCSGSGEPEHGLQLAQGDHGLPGADRRPEGRWRN